MSRYTDGLKSQIETLQAEVSDKNILLEKLSEECTGWITQCQAAEAVVDKLPKCWRVVDGVLVQDWPVIPTETYWCGFRDSGWHVEKCEWTADGWKMESGSTPEEGYLVVCNTEAAAKEASDSE